MLKKMIKHKWFNAILDPETTQDNSYKVAFAFYVVAREYDGQLASSFQPV